MTGRVLVTGGAGYIGRHVVAALVAQGHGVRVLDDLSIGRPDAVHPAAELLAGDIVDADAVAAAMQGVTHVVHLAARRAVPRSFDDPAGTDLVNRIGTGNVVDAARRAGVRRVVCASSSSVYGDARIVPTPETTPFAPRSPYAESKVAGEALCRAAASRHFDTASLRYFNVYGPGQPADVPYAMLIPCVIDALERGEAVTVHGDGTQRRDFTYITDAVGATLAALFARDDLRGRGINVAGGRAWSVLDVVGLVAAALRAEPRVEFAPRRRGDADHTEADLRLAARLLGYAPAVGLRRGVRNVVAHSTVGHGPGVPVAAIR